MSFLEKLKKSTAQNPMVRTAAVDMQDEGSEAEENDKQETTASFAAYKKTSRIRKLGEANSQIIAGEPKEEGLEEEEEEEQEEINEEEEMRDTSEPKTNKNAKGQFGWPSSEGQLTVDVYQTDDELVLESAIAGMKVEDLDVLIEDEVVTIKGKRNNPLNEKADYFVKECYWGKFSRKIILPVEVDAARADASMKEGILIIRMPKILHEKKKKVAIKG